MFFFTPRYIKQAKLLYKGVTRFLAYKKDLLSEERLGHIEGLRQELKQAMETRNQVRIGELTPLINQACERALPMGGTSAFAENIEVFFVSVVIALGIRAYIAQPFQIPTGSMQPTLNGYIASSAKENPDPGAVGRFLGFFTGTSYINVESDHEGYLDMRNPITEHQFLIFRPYCKVHFEDGHSIKISAPERQLKDELGLYDNLRANVERFDAVNPDMRQDVRLRYNNRILIKKGQLLARGILRNGDHVIVNKFAYHFRKPTRGEVFVFTTKNIRGIENGQGFNMDWGSQHYIKRLAGVPGDQLDIKSPELLINGSPAVETGLRRVIDEAKPLSEGYAYHGYSSPNPGMLPVKLEQGSQRDEYFAMGDNSYNSSDSRYWGPVPEQNLVGAGWFCYWPLSSHFGRIR